MLACCPAALLIVSSCCPLFHSNQATTMSDNDLVNEEEDEEIDEEQVADYCAMLDKLGSFPVRSPRGPAPCTAAHRMLTPSPFFIACPSLVFSGKSRHQRIVHLSRRFLLLSLLGNHHLQLHTRSSFCRRNGNIERGESQAHSSGLRHRLSLEERGRGLYRYYTQ